MAEEGDHGGAPQRLPQDGEEQGDGIENDGRQSIEKDFDLSIYDDLRESIDKGLTEVTVERKKPFWCLNDTKSMAVNLVIEVSAGIIVVYLTAKLFS